MSDQSHGFHYGIQDGKVVLMSDVIDVSAKIPADLLDKARRNSGLGIGTNMSLLIRVGLGVLSGLTPEQALEKYRRVGSHRPIESAESDTTS